MNARVAAVEELERRIGYVFSDRQLFERALTHASVKGSRNVLDNERLEFLGDRVLALVVAEHLMQIRPEASEGDLSKLMSQLVNYQACAAVARAVGLPEALRFDAGATKIGARRNDKVLGDACEALIAAIYRDAGLPRARAFILEFWADMVEALDRPDKNPKSLLQEWAMARALPLPEYVVAARTGPPHAPVFTIECRVKGLSPVSAEAGSKREAERLAAEAMLAHIEAGA